MGERFKASPDRSTGEAESVQPQWRTLVGLGTGDILRIMKSQNGLGWKGIKSVYSIPSWVTGISVPLTGFFLLILNPSHCPTNTKDRDIFFP